MAMRCNCSTAPTEARGANIDADTRPTLQTRGDDVRLAIIFLLGLLTCLPSVAAESSRQEVARDLGAVLAWRMGPETIEERCRSADPEGVDVRKKALDTWLGKNAPLISAVDARVDEVAPLMFPARPGVDVLKAVRAQVKAILLESFAGRSAEEVTAICKLESDPARPRWTSNGLPKVQESLAALYDWKVQHEGGPAGQ
jgi:hypothetical protein